MTDKLEAMGTCCSVLDQPADVVDERGIVVANDLVARLWLDSGELSTEALEREADAVPAESRGEFVANLIDLVQDLERTHTARDKIASRVADEIAAACGGDEGEGEPYLDLGIDLED